MTAAWGSWGIRAVMNDDVAKYRGGWTLAPLTAKKKLERLRTFFQFCMVRGWIKSNPALGLKAPRVVQKPTLPFTDAEIEKILWATEVYPAGGFYGAGNSLRMRAFVLLLLNTGLRLQDAVTLSFDRIQKNRLLLYTQKTGTPVHIPLPPVVMEALEKAPYSSNLRPFWSGQGDPRSATKDWQRSLRRLFKLAGIADGHAHRFRDSFACRLLVKGVPLGEVSILLGHSSIAIAQKHYAPWIRERQERLEELVKRTWA
ncbi:MAG: tyrosine-type recombinase/integrase [Terriglobales bacterium]